jgi:sulfate adenylyltransferase subunit 2
LNLGQLEAEATHILREAMAEGRNPAMLFSAGKDSTAMAHVALRAFYPKVRFRTLGAAGP